MRLSRLFAPTLRENPTDAVAISHQLLTRAGFIRQSASGIYTFLHFGNRVLRKLSDLIVREMDSVGGCEISMPLLLPKEMWDRTGRWQTIGEEMFRLQDRKGAALCLGPTHEECVTQMVASEVNSYRQLPLRIYQIGKKYRDETRPRFGLIRGREFIMKDMYSFDGTHEKALESYRLVSQAYERIFQSLRLPYVKVEADSGNIGGKNSHEFQIACGVGEDVLIRCEQCGYAANIEKAASGLPISAQEIQSQDDISLYRLSYRGRIACLVAVPKRSLLNLHAAMLQWSSLQDITAAAASMHSSSPSHALHFDWSEVTAEGCTADQAAATLAGSQTTMLLADASLGSIERLQKLVPPLAAVEVAASRLIHRPEIHYQLPLGRTAETGGSAPCSCASVLIPSYGLEVGHVFDLETKYSVLMGAMITREDGSTGPAFMGCYGIGVSRVVAAVAEVHHDKNGLVWPAAIAPYKTCIVPMNSDDDATVQAAEKIYEASSPDETVLDDRWSLSGGVRLKDALLVGYPEILIVGKRGVASRQAELIDRRTGETRPVPLR